MCLSDDCGEVSEGRRSFLGGVFGTLAASALASRVLGRQQTQQQPPKPAAPLEPLALGDPGVAQRDFTFRSGGAEMRAFLARPRRAGRFPLVVIFSPNPGLTDDLRNTAAQLARGGFLGLAYDTYSRDPGITVAQVRERFDYFAGREFDGLNRRDMAAGVEYVRRQPFYRRGPVGAMGFCGGARQALIFSTEFAQVGAVVNFYGPPVLNPAAYQSRKGPFKPDVMDVLDKIRAPVQCHYGAADPIIPLADVERLGRDLKAQGTPAEVYVYEGAAHAFYDFTRPRFHPEAARLAHARMIQFLQKHLG
ncbi:MAG TPA: dienelactone hydrolase family protein [Pyrinomonadaceae bacterium]|jgi:carboxymethylenebutenolidase